MVQTSLTWYSVDAWKRPLWYTLSYSVMLQNMLARMENFNISHSIWAAHVWVPGMWEHGKFDEVIAKIER